MKRPNKIGIKEIREHFRLSRNELADLMDVSESMLTKIENGHRRIPERFMEIFLALSHSVSRGPVALSKADREIRYLGNVPKRIKDRIRFIELKLIGSRSELHRMQQQRSELLMAQETLRAMDFQRITKKEDREQLKKWIELQIMVNEKKLKNLGVDRMVEIQSNIAAIEAELAVLLSGFDQAKGSLK